MHWKLSSTPGSSTSSLSSSDANTNASANSQAGPSRPAPRLNRFDTVLEDETKYQAMQYTTPTELPGCMTLFDEFMMCYALVPQLRSFYRQGEFRNCDWKWRDFKYCLSLKSESEESRRELWIKRKAEWWARRRMERSSEDVWDVRTEPLKDFPPASQIDTAATS